MPTALTPKLCSEAVATIRPAAQAFAASGGALQSSFAAVCPGSCWAVAYFGFCAVTGNTSSRRLPCLWEVPCFLFQLCLPACKAKTVELPEAFSKTPEDLTLFDPTPCLWHLGASARYFCNTSQLDVRFLQNQHVTLVSPPISPPCHLQ
ncbi:unnamed protein product [Effrenium voratum]|uniref:Uncharacterized protein n=1 Tax=Effrenium voratum TaxID=2562239 RepID=A0AA36IJY0_9DINO|nr:unnamed protein product [Effrenium voratum]CAJ1388119.1 unnamed protein product [Effrenium voratum]CAJ1425293.1 unnamed protein product [Effrenium voratum]CAJ1439208.1 unnamed protein product [Effrenium voratum]